MVINVKETGGYMADNDSTMKKVDEMIEKQGISPDGVSKEDKKQLADDIEVE